jgi:hypothetical protein
MSPRHLLLRASSLSSSLALFVLGGCPDAAGGPDTSRDAGTTDGATADSGTRCPEGPTVTRAEFVEAAVGYLRGAFGRTDGFEGGTVTFLEGYSSFEGVCPYTDESALVYFVEPPTVGMPAELPAARGMLAVGWTASGEVRLLYVARDADGDGTDDLDPSRPTWNLPSATFDAFRFMPREPLPEDFATQLERLRAEHPSVRFEETPTGLMVIARVGRVRDTMDLPDGTLATIERVAETLRRFGDVGWLEGGSSSEIPFAPVEPSLVPATVEEIGIDCLRSVTRAWLGPVGDFDTRTSFYAPLGDGPRPRPTDEVLGEGELCRRVIPACEDGLDVSRSELVSASIDVLREAYEVSTGFEGGDVHFLEGWNSTSRLCRLTDQTALVYVAPIPESLRGVVPTAPDNDADGVADVPDRVTVAWTLAGTHQISFLSPALLDRGSWPGGTVPDEAVLIARDGSDSAAVSALVTALRADFPGLELTYLEGLQMVTISGGVSLRRYGELALPPVSAATVRRAVDRAAASGLFQAPEWSGAVYRIPYHFYDSVPLSSERIETECLRVRTQRLLELDYFGELAALAPPLGAGSLVNPELCRLFPGL